MVEKHEGEVDYQQLAEPLQEQLHLTTVLKEVLYERVKAWQNWQNQQVLPAYMGGDIWLTIWTFSKLWPESARPRLVLS